MSDGDSFINEVSEELRRDRMFSLWRRYGAWVIGAVVAAVVAAAVAQWLSQREVERSERVGAALIEAAEAPGAEARARAFRDVAQTAEAGPALVARLSEAGALAEAGETARAADLLDSVAADEAAGPIYRDLARLKAASLRAAEMTPGQRIAAFDALAAEGAPFRLLALEQRAAAHLAAGDAAAARADAEAALADPMATGALRERVGRLLALAGGAEDRP